MITPPLKTHISSRARYLSPADYKDIMQYRDMKSKPLVQLSKKYNISNSRLYQIWRGQEFNRIQWNDLAVAPSTNVIDKQNEERQAERDFKINLILPLQRWKTRYTMLELANLLIQFRKKVQAVRQKRPEERNGPKGVNQYLEQKKKLFRLLTPLKMSWICIRELIIL